jgi:histidinol phosphatase-like PHP family hydrolase
MKIDLHVHSAERSRCAVSGEEEMIRAAISFGLDALVFTDHQALLPPQRAEELNERFAPFRVFRGIECSVVEGEDLVVLGADHPRLEAADLSYGELHEIVHKEGGFLILAHPFRYHETVDIDVLGRPPHAVELHSISICGRDEGRILALAKRAGARTVQDSDAHRSEHVGIFHNLLGREPRDEKELVAVLKAGLFERCRCDDRVAQRNRDVLADEERMRDYIARGYDGKKFREETGGNLDHFSKVRRGGSYLL